MIVRRPSFFKHGFGGILSIEEVFFNQRSLKNPRIVVDPNIVDFPRLLKTILKYTHDL